jgi:hypothetical protein
MPKLNRRRRRILAPRALRPQKKSGGKAALIYQRVEDDAFHLADRERAGDGWEAITPCSAAPTAQAKR